MPTPAEIARTIQEQARDESLRVNQHGQQELVEEAITLDQLLQALRACQILEDYPEHLRGACCLVLGYTEAERPLHVVCTTSLPILVIITVYEPQPPKWVTPTREGPLAMQCSIRGCPGTLEPKRVVHTVRHRGRVIVIDNVPAEVCSVCGDILFPPETVRHIEAILTGQAEPSSTVPLYQYA